MSRPRFGTQTVGIPNGLAEDYAVMRRQGSVDAGRQWAMVLHGSGTSPTLFWVTHPVYGLHSQRIGEAGLVAVCPDAAGPASWSNDAFLAACDAAYAYATGTLGLAATCALWGVSMNGGGALNWGRRNKAKVRSMLLMAPASDLDYFYANGWGAELDAAYGGNYAANGAGHNPIDEAAEFGWCPTWILHGDADATVPLAQSQAFVAAVDDPDVTLEVIAGAGHSLGTVVSSTDTIRRLAA